MQPCTPVLSLSDAVIRLLPIPLVQPAVLGNHSSCAATCLTLLVVGMHRTNRFRRTALRFLQHYAVVVAYFGLTSPKELPLALFVAATTFLYPFPDPTHSKDGGVSRMVAFATDCTRNVVYS